MNNITAKLTLFHAIKRYELFTSTDIESVREILPADSDPILTPGATIDVYDRQLDKKINWTIRHVEVNVHSKDLYYPDEATRAWQGNINSFTVSIVVYVVESA